MDKNELYKIIITLFNLFVLCWLPYWFGWHCYQVKKFKFATFDWWLQVLICIAYLGGINCEIPAMWSRLLAYYSLRTVLPDYMYVLTTWDRWGHQLFYLLFSLITWCITKKQIPEMVKHTLLNQTHGTTQQH